MTSEGKQLLHKGSLIELYKEKVPLTNGGNTYFDIVKHPGGAVIAAINEKHELCLLKQWRHAVQQTIWELPAGCLEPGEAPLITAQRELEEETGFTASEWQELGVIIPSPGFCNELLHCFLAKKTQPGTLKLDEAEQLEAHWLPLERVFKMAQNGDIQDAKTLAVLLRISKLDKL